MDPVTGALIVSAASKGLDMLLGGGGGGQAAMPYPVEQGDPIQSRGMPPIQGGAQSNGLPAFDSNAFKRELEAYIRKTQATQQSR